MNLFQLCSGAVLRPRLTPARCHIGLIVLLTLAGPPLARAEPGFRLPATGGVSQIEGSAGGGLTPWALIAGYGSRDQIGATAFVTRADPSHFTLQSQGVALGIHDRLELSAAKQAFGLGSTVPGRSIRQDVIGVKLKVAGDAVYDQDRWLPQVAIGLQYKHNLDMEVPTALGARRGTDADYYVAATKVWLAGPFGHSWLGNLTLRATRANQLGLLGFGGDLNDRYRVMPELSVGVLLTDRLMLGAEHRRKPNNLSAFREDAYSDLFVAWFPSKYASLTGAWVDLGRIADKDNQRAVYLSLQLSL